MPYGRLLPDSSWSNSSLHAILEQSLMPIRHHKPVLLGTEHYGSRGDLEKKHALKSGTIKHNYHKALSHSEHFGLTGSLLQRQYQNFSFKIVFMLKSQFSKEKQFFWGFSDQKDNALAPKIGLGCLSV